MKRNFWAIAGGTALAICIASMNVAMLDRENENPAEHQPTPHLQSADAPQASGHTNIQAFQKTHQQVPTPDVSQQPFAGALSIKPDNYAANPSPTNIGPDFTPESFYPAGTSETQHIGEVIDPEDLVHYLNRPSGSRVEIGAFIDPDNPY